MITIFKVLLHLSLKNQNDITIKLRTIQTVVLNDWKLATECKNNT